MASFEEMSAVEGAVVAGNGWNAAIAGQEYGNASIGIAVVGTKHRFHRLDFKYLTPGFSDCEALAQKLGKRIEKSQTPEHPDFRNRFEICTHMSPLS